MHSLERISKQLRQLLNRAWRRSVKQVLKRRTAMPLHKGKSEATFKENVREMVKAGHPVKQAVAAAYRERGEDEHANQEARLAAGLHVTGRDRAKLKR